MTVFLTANLKTHASSKHEKKLRQCLYCSFNTTWNTSFHEHMRDTHGLFQRKSKYADVSETHPILCDDCGFSTFNQKQFRAHKLDNCQSQPILPHVPHEGAKYPCDKCDYKATYMSNLRAHIKRKHEGVNYPCDQCNYIATQKAHL